MKNSSNKQVGANSSVTINTQGNSVSPNVQDIILLSVADKYRVGETKYPEYFRSRYGIGFPKERFIDLEKKGYIRPSSSTESLPHLKTDELKSIASQFGLKSSGKKNDLCARIAENVSEAYLDQCVSERYWNLTDSGRVVLNENPHIGFYLEKHPYSLSEIGLDINTYAKLFENKQNGTVRDRLWGEFNRRSISLYKKGMTKGEFRDYCELLRTMALFLEEENRHKDALAMYMRYIHYRANFEASLAAINYYSALRKVNDAADILYTNAEIYPFIAKEILAMSNGCEFDSKQLQVFMEEAFSKEKDTGIFTPTELANLVMFGLNGDQEGQKKICKNAMKAAVKKMSR